MVGRGRERRKGGSFYDEIGILEEARTQRHKVMGKKEKRERKSYTTRRKRTFPPLIIHTNTNKGTCLL